MKNRIDSSKKMKITLWKMLYVIALIALAWGCQKTILVDAPTTHEDPEVKRAASLKRVFYAQYQKWYHVPYRLGGMSRQGVDCSGFVYLTYKQQLGISLPRTTKGQSKLGEKVSRESLRIGDLVFFKTGFFTRHVGIYLEDKLFLHASTRKGVIISSLDEKYWSGHYWKAKRLYFP